MNRLVKIYDRLMGRGGSPRTEVHEVRGFRVELTNSRSDIAAAAVVERLNDALALIERYQPIRYAHLRRDIRVIVVQRFASRGAYLHEHRAILTELTFLARRDIGPEVVASSVLHEGVHARTFCLARSQAGTQPAREERICRRAELTFGQALPGAAGAPVIARALESLALDDVDVAPRFTAAEGQAAVERVDRAQRGAS
ncbi:MAG: hypothetical protein Q8K55_11305 [Gemmatimonadaceae bacterium]|nr:hypothetical protein [Gemmatimonadaceae bacterium]